MRKTIARLIASFSLIMIPVQSYAATTATATVTYTVGTILALTVSGNPGAFTVNTATAGSQPASQTDTSTTYAVTTNGSATKLTAAVGAAMPTGVTLGVNAAAPTGATSAGNLNLTTTAQNMVTGIANLAQSGLTLTYTFTATTSAATVSNATATVTYTVQ